MQAWLPESWRFQTTSSESAFVAVTATVTHKSVIRISLSSLQFFQTYAQSQVECTRSMRRIIMNYLEYCRVREDIVHSLQLQNVYTALSSFDRPNIFHGIKCLNSQSVFLEELVKVLNEDVGQGSTIIYCLKVKMVDRSKKRLCWSIHWANFEEQSRWHFSGIRSSRR